jgi:hypothetical protein
MGQKGMYVREDNPDTTLETVIKVTFASTTSEDLSLDDQIIILCFVRNQYMVSSWLSLLGSCTELLGYRLGFFGRESNISGRNTDTILCGGESRQNGGDIYIFGVSFGMNF